MQPCLRPWQTTAYRPSDQYVVQDTGSCLISPGPRTLDHQRRRIEIGPDNRSIVSSAKIIQRVLRTYILQSHPGSVTERRRLVPCQRSDEPLTQAEGCGSFVLCCESGFIFFKFSVEGIHFSFKELRSENRAYLDILLIDSDSRLSGKDQELAEYVAPAQVQTRIRFGVAGSALRTISANVAVFPPSYVLKM